MVVSRVSPTALRIGSSLMIAHGQTRCNSVSDPEGGRAALDFEAPTKGVHRGPANNSATGTPSIQLSRGVVRGAEQNNGLGEAVSGSCPATAERRSMVVSRVSPTALRIGSEARIMIADAQAHCNSGSDF